jgi:hypothetical protein
MALTLEEQRELEELEALEAQEAVPAQEVAQPAALTAEEQIELEELEALEAEQDESISTSSTEAFVRGAADELSFGLADEAEAIVETIADGIAGELENVPLGEAYEQNVDATRKEYAKARETHGLAYGSGQASGIAASLIAGAGVGKLAAKGTGVLAKSAARLLSGTPVQAAAKVGAIQGALTGAGRGEGVEQSLKDALVGAVGGAAVGGAVAKGATAVAKSLAAESSIRNRVFNAFGIRTAKIRRQVDNTLKTQNKDMSTWISELADEKVITPNAAGTGIEETAESLMKFTDSQEDIILKAEGNIGLYEEAREALLSKIPIKNPSTIINQLDDAVDNVFVGGRLGVGEQRAIAQIKKDLRARMTNAVRS